MERDGASVHVGHVFDFGLLQAGADDTQASEVEREFMRSLAAGFCDACKDSVPRYAPRLLLNDRESSSNVLSGLEREFGRCERFDLSVAFVTADGVTVLMSTLLDLERRHVPGRVLVSTYLTFTDPDALVRLRRFRNVELRVHEGALHSKGYLFAADGPCTLVVGSSNLTQKALLENSEWNLLVNTYEGGSVWVAACREFERLWGDDATHVVDDAWLEGYRSLHARRRLAEGRLEGDLARINTRMPRTIVPNSMQREALRNLAHLRERNESKALLISATGTGKTYLAAFDVAQMGVRRVLFVVHRERIARDALESFRRVCGCHHSYGVYVGGERDRDADFLFATIQTLTRHIEEFEPCDFDYVVLDEAHHGGASSYKRVLAWFRPRFLLGMTATAQRMDGLDVFGLFDNNIAYQITLQRAEEEHLLAPFHYFGIADLSVDGQTIDEESAFSRLTSDARVTHLIAEIERYTVASERRGLVFCSRIDEAHELSHAFNERGWRTVALDGKDSDEVRERAIERLEGERSEGSDWLELIFCRDVFNEGVDIPSLNLIVMCRATESATIFVQQLGRGLRRLPGKEYVLVLDFIGNYRKSYLIPIALSGDRSYNKDNIRRFIRESRHSIVGCSTIDFDEVSRDHIYRMLDAEKFGSVRLVRQEYDTLKGMLGRIPTLMDFREMGSVDPALIFSAGKLGSYHAFLSRYEKSYTVRFTEAQEQMLRYVSLKLSGGKRIQDLLMLRKVMEGRAVEESSFAEEVHAVSAALPVSFRSACRVLDGSHNTGSARQTYAEACFVTTDGTRVIWSDALRQALSDPEFARQLREVIDIGLANFSDRYLKGASDDNLCLYAKYTYEDVCMMLEWEHNVSGQNIGGYKYDSETNTFPVFINYEKGEDIAETIRYHDRFRDPSHLIAISKQPRRMNSPEIERLRCARETNMRIYLFVRKNKDDSESKEFYYLGRMWPTGTFEPVSVAGKPAVEISYELTVPVAEELFDYLTSGEG